MPRVKGHSVTRKRRKLVLLLAKGYRGAKTLLFKAANAQVMVYYRYAFRDRRARKRHFRRLWIARINAAARILDISYSKHMHGLLVANVTLLRKMLADLAVSDPDGFKDLADTAKLALA